MKKSKNNAFLVAMLCAGLVMSFSGLTAYADEESSETLVAPISTETPSLKDCISTSSDMVDFGELSEGGRSYTQEFQLKNSCDSELVVVAKAQVYDGDAEINNDYKLANDWLTFVGGKSDYALPAKGETSVKIRVFLPNSVKGASYYAAVGLSLKDSQNTEDKQVVNVRMDVLSDGFTRGGMVTSNYAQAFGFGKSVRAGVKLKNTGTSGFLSKYTLKRGAVFGSEDFQTLVEDAKEIPAGAEVEFYAGDYVSDQYGIFKIQQTVTYINSDGETMESVLEQTVINVPLVVVFIVGGALVALISLIIVVKIMKRRKAEEQEDSKQEDENEL